MTAGSALSLNRKRLSWNERIQPQRDPSSFIAGMSRAIIALEKRAQRENLQLQVLTESSFGTLYSATNKYSAICPRASKGTLET